MTPKVRLWVAVGLLALGAVVVTVNRSGGGGSQPLVVYSARSGAAIRPAVDAFRKRSGTAVTVVEGAGLELEARLVAEKAQPRADVFVGTDTSTYERVAREGIFVSYVSPEEQRLSALYRSKDGYGRGIAGRAWVIIYNTARVKAADAPQSVFDLTQAKWKGQVAVAGYHERATLYWTQALLAVVGEEKTKTYVESLTANGLQILGGDEAVRTGVAQGRFAVGLTEAADAYHAIAAGAPLGVVYPDQGDGGIGTLVRPHIVATVAGPNRTGAKRFVDFLLSGEGQSNLVTETAEVPLVAGTPLPTIVGGQPIKGLNDFREMKVGYEALAELTEETAKLFAPTFGAAPGVEEEKGDQETPGAGQEKGEYQTPPSGVEKGEKDHPEGSTRP